MYILLNMKKGVHKKNLDKLTKFLKSNAILHPQSDNKRPNNDLQQPRSNKSV